MITNFKNFNLITESPDKIYQNHKVKCLNDAKDAVPFFFEVNKNHTKVEELWIGPNGSYHSNMNITGVERAYAGRLWLDSKIIAFWVYPNKKLFESMVEALEFKLDIDIFFNNWKIEIIKTDKNKIKRSEYKRFGKKQDFYFGGRSEYMDAKIFQLISIEDYLGSDNVPKELQIQHLMNWEEKELAKKLGEIHFTGFGSDKTSWDQPHNLKYRQAIYQENKKP